MDLSSSPAPLQKNGPNRPWEDTPIGARRVTLPKLATIVGASAVLYIAKDIFLPLAIAMLITFALSPIVTRLRRTGLSQLWTVLAVVAGAIVAIALFFLIVAAQLGQLAQNLPTFQANIITKLDKLEEAGKADGVLSRVSRAMQAINAKMGAAMGNGADPEGGATATEPSADVPETKAPSKADPMPVEVVQSRSPVQVLQDLILPLVSPVATVGLVIVVVIFMLLEREDLRDRFIRLVGSNDLHRTTQVIEDAGSRVANYLLIQLLVNTIYALPVGIGLWLIGVPNAPLWALLTLILRFVPYVGSVLSAAFPLFLAFAATPGWAAVLWTIALFAVIEIVTSNVIEPWLYGSRTGVSSLAIIVSAIFWTFLWGPLGLVLSTPLTVCLVVLGRHIPQFELFDILFGDEPVLAPSTRMYQRLLAGDGVEITFRAEEELEDVYLSEYYRDVGIPALLLAQMDYDRGRLNGEQLDRLARAGLAMVDNLQPVVEDEREELRGATPAEADTAAPPSIIDNDTPDGTGFNIVCVGGRTALDDVSAAMLAQVMRAEGSVAAARPHGDLSPTRLGALIPDGAECLVLAFLDPAPSRASLLHVRRVKRAAPGLRVGVVIWQNAAEGQGQDADSFPPVAVAPEKLAEAEDLGADFAVTTIDAALAASFTRAPPKAVPPPPRTRAARAKARKVKA